ncbi:MAG: right-handed parallel beta-helix repeat-containing protein [Desulfuromonadaceae bacterium]
MKLFFAICLVIGMPLLSPAADLRSNEYTEAVISEDVTWRGSIVVRGFVVVAPQATLRVEPGTVVRFAKTATGHMPNLVVQGRLQASGSVEQPIVFTSDSSSPSRGEWGGIVLLSTEKRNQLDQCRIKYAQSGVDARFSNITLNAVAIEQAQTGVLSYDSVVQMNGSSVTDSGTGIEIHTSEFEARGITLTSCQRGALFYSSSVLISTARISNNLLSGLELSDCRIKITSGDISENELGIRIKGGEGQLFMTSFLRNKRSALHLLGSRVKIQRCLFADNSQDAVRTEDGLALLMNNAFSGNDGFNLYNAGSEGVSARQNWWGTTDQRKISQKIYDQSRDKNAGIVQMYPWLNEKPQLTP